MSIGQWTRRLLVLFFLMAMGIVLASEHYPDEYRRWSEAYQRWIERGWSDWGVAGTVQWVLGIFVAPVAFVEAVIMSFFDLSRPEEGWERGAFGLQLLILSFIFWATLISRSLSLAGVYNPFWNSEKRKRGIVLRSLIKLRDWWERATRFGREPTARWASLAEVMSHRYCGGDIFLGRPKLIAGGLMRPVGIKTEKHFLTFGSPGSGKSTAALVPNLIVHEGGLCCLDVKGELAKITATRRRDGLGQDTFVVDPYGLVPEANCSRYNPFDEMAEVAKIDPGRAIGYAEKIAEALVRPTTHSDNYWDNASKTFIRGLILYIFAYEPEEKRNLLRLRELIMAGDVERYEQSIKEGLFKRGELDAFEVLLETMKSVRDGPYDGAISSAAASIAMMGDGQRGSVVTSAQEQTAFLDTPEIRKVCETSDFLLGDFGKRPISVYLVMPLNQLKGAQGRWLRMFVLLFIDMMIRQTKPPPLPVLLAIDEFPNLGKLDGIELVAPTMRSYGVRFWAIAQDVSQLKATYPDTWTSIVGGAEAVQFMGLHHPATVDFLVERLGNMEVNRGKFRELRPLLDADQVSKFLAKENKNQIIWYGSRRPMKLKLCPYYEYLPWSFYNPDPRYKEQPLRALWRSVFGRVV